MRSRIGECLVKTGLITEADLRRALAERAVSGERLGAVLVRLNLATEAQIAQALASQLGFAYIDLPDGSPNPAAVRLIPKGVAVSRAVVAIELENDLLTVAMADPLQFSVVQELERHAGLRIRPVLAPRADIMAAIERWYDDVAGPVRPSGPSDAVVDPASTASIPDLVDGMLQRALERDASEVHIEPMEREVLVRCRIGGLLEPVERLAKTDQGRVAERIKVMAGMDASDTRLAQDGRLRLTSTSRYLDFHVSTFPTTWGEKIVLRALDARRRVPAPDELGLSPVALDQLRQLGRRDHGLILFVGPARSGRSTTAWSSLNWWRAARVDIVAVEDAIEYAMPGVIETRVSDHSPATFANAVRSALRERPDVILVGEISDAETAELAVAAARKRIVLSTLRADAAASALSALSELRVEPSEIARSLVGAVAQRLVRRVCTRCRQQYSPSFEMQRALNISEADASKIALCRPAGCDDCNYTGYRGRVGLYEVMRITDRLKRLIAANAPVEQLRDAAIAGGMVALAEDGVAKATGGVTAPEEVLRVVGDIGEPRPLCRQCGRAVSADFLACPACGARLGGACRHCGRALQPAWSFCPYCARSIASAPTSAGTPGRERKTVPGTRRARGPGNVAEFKK